MFSILFKFYDNFKGYFRVNYDKENWQLLIRQLNTDFKAIHPVNRAQLIDDSLMLAADEKLSFKIPFTLLCYIDNETDPMPLFSAFKNLIYLSDRFYSSSLKVRKENHKL